MNLIKKSWKIERKRIRSHNQIWRHSKGPNAWKFNLQSDGSLSMARQIGLKSRDFPREWCELGGICWHWRGLKVLNFASDALMVWLDSKLSSILYYFVYCPLIICTCRSSSGDFMDLLESIRLPSIWWYFWSTNSVLFEDWHDSKQYSTDDVYAGKSLNHLESNSDLIWFWILICLLFTDVFCDVLPSFNAWISTASWL